MSTPPFLKLPVCASAVRLATSRGSFASLVAEPAGPVRGTALLVPGFTGSKEDFIALLEPLAEQGYRTVAVDQRGQYETGGDDEPAAYAIDELALDLIALSAALGTATPLHLLGHSFGGQVSRQAVLTADQRGGPLPWRSLTLLSTGPAAIDPGEAARTKLLIDALGGMSLEEIWQLLQQMDQDKPRPHPEIGEFLHRRWVANRPEALIVMGGHLVSAPDLVAELAEVPLAKQVVSGEQDYAWPVPEQISMADRLGVRHTTVPGALHSPNAEQPAATAAVLAGFWNLTE
ncbi:MULTISPECIES: alpha/beta fold hydrolase [unclassified Kitasatospora]|uniref:alpha/beta fold hydrolase n=1 Tax=unclassified Kitasatospora TaxID=2633591 RepID=UPI0007104B96|nr:MULTISPECIES: alpha/beta hydrolase [unclassified Kitasatospora]KQV23845.1 hydrolase [Kitasatospora sp. Root107]KRB67443.1 hydrolase [Kitasatospora sp. Root187]